MKKGSVIQSGLFLAIQLVLALMVGWGLLSFAAEAKDNNLLMKNYFIRDIALLIDTMYSTSHDMYYVYDHIFLEKYNLYFSSQLLSIMEDQSEDNKNPIPYSYPYAEDLIGYKEMSEKKSLLKKEVTLSKSGHIFDIGGIVNYDEECDYAKNTMYDTVFFMIGDEELGPLNEDAKNVALHMGSQLTGIPHYYDFLLEDYQPEYKPNELILVIKIGKYKDNFLKVFTAKDSDKKVLQLGCLFSSGIDNSRNLILNPLFIKGGDYELLKLNNLLIMEVGGTEEPQINKQKLSYMVSLYLK